MPITIDVSIAPQNFTSFPVVIHEEEPKISDAQRKARKVFEPYMPEHLRAQYYSEGPHGNVYAMTFFQGPIERGMLSAELLEGLWLYDDVTESLPHDQADNEHASIEQSLASRGEVKSRMASYFRDLASRMMALDPEGAPFLIGQLHQHFTEYDKRSMIYETMEDYLMFRTLNVGFRITVAAMQWCHSIYLTDKEDKLVHEFYAASSRVLALSNDYWSWDREKNDVDALSVPIPNAVWVIMRQYNMKEKEAKIMLKGLIVEAEQTVKKLGLEILKLDVSESVRKFVEDVYFVLGANGFWSATCPRYNGE